MSELSLRHYRAILLVSELRSFTLASRSMFITLAALSKVISEAETRLAFKVFERSSKGVSLTGPGEVFLPYVKKVITAHEVCIDSASMIRDNRLGTLRIAGTQMVNSAFLLSIASEFSAQHSGIELNVFESRAETLQQEVGRGTFDLAVGPRRVVDRDLQAIDICSVPLFFVSPRDKSKPRKTIRWSEILDKKIIFTDPRAALHIAGYLNNKYALNEWMVIESVTTALATVEAGRGFMISSSYTARLASAFNVDFVKLVDPQVDMGVAIYFRATTGRAGLVENVATALAEQIRARLE